MALKDLVKPKEPAPKPESIDVNFNKAELTMLLNAMSEATFTGRQLEPVFNLVVKLQQAHSQV